MQQTPVFNILFLVARPAAGKSEIIDYLKRTEEDERLRRFHIGAFSEIDDFPMLWTWFEEDAILERMGKPRLHTDAEGYFLHDYLWHLLIERMALDYAKLRRDYPVPEDEMVWADTVIIEFARGAEHGGWREAFAHFPVEMLRRAAILYIDVSWEESLRKNRKRANPDRPDSILEHSVPDEKLTRLYKESDWTEFTAEHPYFVTINGVKVPYRAFDNHDDVTTSRGHALGQRLAETLESLWESYLF